MLLIGIALSFGLVGCGTQQSSSNLNPSNSKLVEK